MTSFALTPNFSNDYASLLLFICRFLLIQDLKRHRAALEEQAAALEDEAA